MPKRKEAIDLSGLPEKQRQELLETDNAAAISSKGVDNDVLVEAIPSFNEAPAETVYPGKNNSWIVLGRDRPAGMDSGYGGQGHTQAGSIDLVVGRGAPSPKIFDEEGNELLLDPDFTRDAARIVLSQKTDIDDNFHLKDGNVGNVKARSGIGVKADAIRIIARDGGIKLVTRTDAKNSQGGDVKVIRGIDLMAANLEKELQPMVKGEDLVAALKELNDNLGKLIGIVDNILTALLELVAALASHTHISSASGSPTTPSAELATIVAKISSMLISTGKVGLFSHRAKLVMWTYKYLYPTGVKFINSLYNRVN